MTTKHALKSNSNNFFIIFISSPFPTNTRILTWLTLTWFNSNKNNDFGINRFFWLKNVISINQEICCRISKTLTLKPEMSPVIAVKHCSLHCWQWNKPYTWRGIRLVMLSLFNCKRNVLCETKRSYWKLVYSHCEYLSVASLGLKHVGY